MIPVLIYPPRHWWLRPRIKLSAALTVCGHAIPSGYVTDGATVPRILWPLVHPFGKGLEAAILHDWLLTTGCPRAYADEEYRKALIYHGVNPRLAEVMYLCVRLWSVASAGRPT